MTRRNWTRNLAPSAHIRHAHAMVVICPTAACTLRAELAKQKTQCPRASFVLITVSFSFHTPSRLGKRKVTTPVSMSKDLGNQTKTEMLRSNRRGLMNRRTLGMVFLFVVGACGYAGAQR